MHEPFDALLDDLTRISGIGPELLADVLSRAVLKAPREVSRNELGAGNPRARRQQLQRTIPQGTVSKAVKALMKVGLFEKGEKSLESEDGRALLPIRVGSSYYTVGVKLRLHDGFPAAVSTVVSSIDGRTLHSGGTLLLAAGTDWSMVPKVICDVVTSIRNRYKAMCTTGGRPAAKLFGVGIEVGAHVHDGVIVRSPGPGLPERAPLAEPVAALLGNSVPVVVENDVNALAVMATHDTPCESDLAVVAVFDEGVGGGLVMDGRVRRGGRGMAMEPGHFTVGLAPGVDPDRLSLEPEGSRPADFFARFDPRCPCGAKGHLDAYATPQRICRALRVDDIGSIGAMPSMTNGNHTPDYDVVFAAGSALGRGLAHVINVVDPAGLLLYLPEELTLRQPDSAASAYLNGMESELHRAYSTGGNALPTIVPVGRDQFAELGARAAGMCVLESFIDHASGADGCNTQRRTNRRSVTAA